MKFSMLLIFLLTLAGCSHIKVVGFDRQAKTVDIQGGKFDSEEDVQKEARNIVVELSYYLE